MKQTPCCKAIKIKSKGQCKRKQLNREGQSKTTIEKDRQNLSSLKVFSLSAVALSTNQSIWRVILRARRKNSRRTITNLCRSRRMNASKSKEAKTKGIKMKSADRKEAKIIIFMIFLRRTFYNDPSYRLPVKVTLQSNTLEMQACLNLAMTYLKLKSIDLSTSYPMRLNFHS